MRKLILLLTILIFPVSNVEAQFHPGGVTDAEMWYYPSVFDIDTNSFPNSAETNIEISNCGEIEDGLLNFNPSFIANSLCLEFKTPWENSTGRSLFFVGVHDDTSTSFSHFYTSWRDDIGFIQARPPFIRFFANLNSNNISGLEINEAYNPDNIAVINYYHLNNYNIDRKWRSYGQTGETSVFIGKSGQLNTPGAENLDDDKFTGNFSEAISFTRELSKNERNRVESYLAIKYGVTLSSNDSYRTSNNIAIWDQDNYGSFSNRIFGLGRDATSNLRQYQSHSIHDANFLVAAIEEIEENNTIKQDLVSIEDKQFLVFGDSGTNTSLGNVNDIGFQYWNRIWLAQRTGETVNTLPIYFKVKLTPEIQEIIASDQGLYFWMLKDNDVENSNESDFSGEDIEYIPAIIDLLTQTATFENVYFDPDASNLDQFTFGVGSEMIVQVAENGCGTSEIPLLITISGGSPTYSIKISLNGQVIDVITTDNQTEIYNAIQGETYDITVYDMNGIVADTSITVDAWDFSVNLGPDQNIGDNNLEFLLDAGVNIPDLDASYQWFKDEILLANESSTLTVTTPGLYKVIVTSADLTCTVEDEVEIGYDGFIATITAQAHCFELFNSITIEITGGHPGFTTTVVGPTTTTSYEHDEDLVLVDQPYGEYSITITDAWDFVYQEVITLIYEDINLDIHEQLTALCNPGENCLYFNNIDPETASFVAPVDLGNFTLDASLGVTQSNIAYQWFINDVPFQVDPVVDFVVFDENVCDAPIVDVIKVVATNTISNCNEYQAFTFKQGTYCILGQGATPQGITANSNANETPVKSHSAIDAIIYPNPNKHGTVFIFEVFSTEIFNGVVEIFTLDGKALIEKSIADQTRYALPFNLRTAGTYLIRVTTVEGEVLTRRVIIE